MFVVLSRREVEGRGLAKITQRLRTPAVTRKRESFLGNWYCRMEVTGKSIPWERVALLSGRAGGRLVLPPELEVPEGYGLGRFRPTILEGRLCALTAVQVAASGPEGAGAVAGLIDEDGVWSWCCRQLAQHFSAVRVWTRRRERYAEFAERLSGELGAPVSLAESPYDLSACSVTVSPGSFGVIKLGCPVITATQSGIQGSPTVNRMRLELPGELEEQIPEGIEPLDFIGAVYELGVRRFPLQFPIRDFRADGRLCEARPGAIRRPYAGCK